MEELVDPRVKNLKPTHEYTLKVFFKTPHGKKIRSQTLKYLTNKPPSLASVVKADCKQAWRLVKRFEIVETHETK